MQTNAAKFLIYTFLFIIASSLGALAQDNYERGRQLANSNRFSEAYNLWKPLADSGHVKAQYNVGRMLARGDGVAKDFIKAHYYFNLAAEKGSAKAQEALGRMYARGDGVSPNQDLSKYWYARARGEEPSRPGELLGSRPSANSDFNLDREKTGASKDAGSDWVVGGGRGSGSSNTLKPSLPPQQGTAEGGVAGGWAITEDDAKDRTSITADEFNNWTSSQNLARGSADDFVVFTPSKNKPNDISEPTVCFPETVHPNVANTILKNTLKIYGIQNKSVKVIPCSERNESTIVILPRRSLYYGNLDATPIVIDSITDKLILSDSVSSEEERMGEFEQKQRDCFSLKESRSLFVHYCLLSAAEIVGEFSYQSKYQGLVDRDIKRSSCSQSMRKKIETDADRAAVKISSSAKSSVPSAVLQAAEIECPNFAGKYLN